LTKKIDMLYLRLNKGVTHMPELTWAIDNFAALKAKAIQAREAATSSWGKNYWTIQERDLQRKIDRLAIKMRSGVDVGGIS
jgi:hypothetical protein